MVGDTCVYFVFPDGEPIRAIDCKYVQCLKVGDLLATQGSNREGIDDNELYRIKSIEHFFGIRAVKAGKKLEDMMSYSGRYFILETAKEENTASPQTGCATNQ